MNYDSCELGQSATSADEVCDSFSLLNDQNFWGTLGYRPGLKSVAVSDKPPLSGTMTVVSVLTTCCLQFSVVGEFARAFSVPSHLCLPSRIRNKILQLRAVDHSARGSMKNAANCEK